MIIASSISHIFRTITSSIIYKSYTEMRVGQQRLAATKKAWRIEYGRKI
jgi:hypothetical protein